MKKAYKTEIKPTQKQIQKINQSIGICRWLYNSYIAKNKELYELYKQNLIPKERAFMSANDFDKYINGQSKFPKFKKKNKSNVKIYFPKNDKSDYKVERHRIMIPTLKM